MLNSPTLSIFQHFHTIPLRSPLISLRSKWRLTGFSRRFTPKNPVRLHKPFGQLPRWGAKNVLPLNLIALPVGGATFDCLRKRFSRFYRFNGFNGFNGGGAAPKNQKHRKVYMGDARTWYSSQQSLVSRFLNNWHLSQLPNQVRSEE